MDYQSFKNRLFEEAEEGYRDFVLGGTITERPLLGVRVPTCRKMAAEVLAGKFDNGSKDDMTKLERAEEFLKNTPVSFEEVLIRGFVVASLPYEKMCKQMHEFILLIDNWAICDCFCAAMKKNVSKHRKEFLEEIDEILKTSGEFQKRVGLVCLLDHYIVPEYLTVVFDRVTEVSKSLSEGAEDMYYVKMAVAWLISVCFAKFPDETMPWFSNLQLARWTYNKAIVKTCESLRVDGDLKAELRKKRLPHSLSQ